jgi:hypothetical protein
MVLVEGAGREVIVLFGYSIAIHRVRIAVEHVAANGEHP